jgi:hypothetical protein
MRALAAVICTALAVPAWAEMRDEEHVVGHKLVKIAVFDTLEIMTVGPSDYEKMQVLSGADIEIRAIVDDADSVALLGQPVVVVDVTGTQSCEAGAAREYWVVTLGAVPAPEGPVTTCQPLTASVTAGALVLTGPGEAWAWSPGKGWAAGAG